MKKMCLFFIISLLTIGATSAAQDDVPEVDKDCIEMDAAYAMYLCVHNIISTYDDGISDAKTIAEVMPELIKAHSLALPSLVRERYCKNSKSPDKCEALFWSKEFPDLSKNNYKDLVVFVLSARSDRRLAKEARLKH
jgi:hypothetical protein